MKQKDRTEKNVICYSGSASACLRSIYWVLTRILVKIQDVLHCHLAGPNHRTLPPGRLIERCTQGSKNAEIFPSVHRMGCDVIQSDRNLVWFGGTYCSHLQARSISQLLACTLCPFYFCQIIHHMPKIVRFVVGESHISHRSQNIVYRLIRFARSKKKKVPMEIGYDSDLYIYMRIYGRSR
jgi:hypothetical protein